MKQVDILWHVYILIGYVAERTEIVNNGVFWTLGAAKRAKKNLRKTEFWSSNPNNRLSIIKARLQERKIK